MKRLAIIAAAVLALLAAGTPAQAHTPTWHRLLNDNFSWNVGIGAWSDCDHNTDTPRAYCSGLPAYASRHWWAYPDSWPDTATQRGYPVGGYYSPETTLSVSGGALHIRMWRGKSGPVHSATVVPKAAMGLTYGAYEERWRVVHAAAGYKSAHLLWPNSNDGCSEIDYPELEWDTTVAAFMHPSTCGDQDAYDTGAKWTSWHTTRIEWTRGSVKFFLDGKLIGHSTHGVPSRPMSWDIQNESALNGESAAPGTWAQMDVDYVRVWSWS